MPWDTILSGIATVLATLTGLQKFERDSPPKITDPTLKAKLEFAVTACSTVGRDERRYIYTAGPDPNATVAIELHGNRKFTLSVKCITYDHGYQNSAEWFLERIYTRLSLPSSQAALNAAGVSWMGAAEFHNLSSTLRPEDRAFSVGQKDLFFLAAVTETEVATDPPIGTIDSVILTSIYLSNVDGTHLGKQIGPTTIGPA
jgi:hypothetical protein